MASAPVEQDSILVSYAHLRDPRALGIFQRFVAKLPRKPHVILDSGAFTAKNIGITIELADYMRFLDDHRELCDCYMALDVVGDRDRTAENLQIMLANGFRPMPVHVRGASEDDLDDLFKLSDVVALAGLRRPGAGPAPPEYVREKMRWALGRPVHWLGMAVPWLLERFRPWSCDTSSWASPSMFGVAAVYEHGQLKKVERREKDTAPSGLLRAMRALGIPMEDWWNDDRWRRRVGETFVAQLVTAFAWIKYGRDVRRQFGTRMHLAVIVEEEHLNLLAQAARAVEADHGA